MDGSVDGSTNACITYRMSPLQIYSYSPMDADLSDLHIQRMCMDWMQPLHVLAVLMDGWMDRVCVVEWICACMDLSKCRSNLTIHPCMHRSVHPSCPDLLINRSIQRNPPFL